MRAVRAEDWLQELNVEPAEANVAVVLQAFVVLQTQVGMKAADVDVRLRNASLSVNSENLQITNISHLFSVLFIS